MTTRYFIRRTAVVGQMGDWFDIVRVPDDVSRAEVGAATYTTFGAAWLAAQAGVTDTWVQLFPISGGEAWSDDQVARRVARRVADGEWVEVLP